MKKINSTDSIRQPIITEKATILSEQNKTVFKVHSSATKLIQLFLKEFSPLVEFNQLKKVVF